eukprot:PhM_4_TR6708/c0_g1_i1/m.64661/K16582/TTLL6_13; tubulin polyglutamylase TTLL6/13
MTSPVQISSSLQSPHLSVSPTPRDVDNNVATSSDDDDSGDCQQQQTSSSSCIQTVSCSTNATEQSTASSSLPKPKKKKGKRKLKKKGRLVVNCTNTRYPLLKEVFESMGYVEETDETPDASSFIVNGVRSSRSECNVLWTDSITSLSRIIKLQVWQHYNHFPMMHMLARKVHLCNTLGKMRKLFSTYYSFFPRTWSLRSDRAAFKKAASGSKKTFILKPNAGCQGKGIIITQNPLGILDSIDDYIAQEYIAKPLLIEGKKFDMRVYVLVTSVKNLSVFVFKEGLVRMCVDDYVRPSGDNFENLTVHLTNTAVNKGSDKYVANESEDHQDVGSKRNFAFFTQWLAAQGHDSKRLWERVDNIVCKTLIAAQPQLAHTYTSTFPQDVDGRVCFELLGFDIMVDHQLKPWLLEVNHAPSLQAESPLDKSIKGSMLRELFNIVNIRSDDRANFVEKEKENFMRRMALEITRRRSVDTEGLKGEDEDRDTQRMLFQHASRLQHENAACVGFRRIFPPTDTQKMAIYSQFLDAAAEASVAPSTYASEQRAKELMNQREKYNSKVAAETKLQRQQQQREREREPTTGRARSNKPPLTRTDSTSARHPQPPQQQQPAAQQQQDTPVRSRRVLEEQMERHRRRMSLGSRVSLIQLREQKMLDDVPTGGDSPSPVDSPTTVPQSASATYAKTSTTYSHGTLAQKLRDALWRSTRRRYGGEEEEEEEE